MIELAGLPFPPTMNHRMIPMRGRLILSPDHRAYKKLLELYLHRKFLLADAENLKEKILKVEVQYVGPRESWFTKKNEIKKKDVENRHKALLDGIFSFLDLDDSQIFEITIKKVVGGSELMAFVKIEEI